MQFYARVLTAHRRMRFDGQVRTTAVLSLSLTRSVMIRATLSSLRLRRGSAIKDLALDAD